MALIPCPYCKKQISSLAKQCQHCDAKLTGDNEARLNIAKINQASKLQTHSFIAMTLFVAGVVIWFWGGEPAEGTRMYAGAVCFTFGFIGYLITRVRIILHKRRSV
ncbi:zinc ribbon domain-containing protein [Parashewanella tropica]|uniref:zinc ribbon domain-containing protein n=1 Tax=Parashewanella tropica TaxID=2547970 RepID=UPI00105A8617|nr:zinc ribbon domain-containing protein [Parashewanella tropica]